MRLACSLLGAPAATLARRERGDFVLYTITGDGIPAGTQVAARIAGAAG